MSKRFTLKEHLTNEYGLLDDGKEIAYISHRSAFTICDLLNDYDLTVKELQNEVEFWKKVYYDFEEPVAKCRRVHHELITLLQYLYLKKDMIIGELPISDESKKEFSELAEYCKSIEDDSLYP